MDNLAWGYPQIRMVHTHLALFLTSVLLLLHQQRAAAVAAAAPAQVSHSLSPAEPHSHGSRCCTTVGRCWLAACGTTFVNQEATKGHTVNYCARSPGSLKFKFPGRSQKRLASPADEGVEHRKLVEGRTPLIASSAHCSQPTKPTPCREACHVQGR